MDNLKKELGKISGGKILDVGTGRGEFIELLKTHLKDYEEIIGIDTSDKAIEYCENRFKDDEKIKFNQMDAFKMDFPKHTFDMVCISNSLHHLENMSTILKEMKRVLKPNGLFLITEMYKDDQTDAQMSHVLVHHWSGKIDTALGVYHAETFKREDIINIALNQDLKDLNVFDYRYPTDNPKDEETIKYFEELIEKVFIRIKNQNLNEVLIEEGRKIKEWIRKYGFQSATELMIIGVK